jgi:hypothetical protein
MHEPEIDFGQHCMMLLLFGSSVARDLRVCGAVPWAHAPTVSNAVSIAVSISLTATTSLFSHASNQHEVTKEALFTL